MTLPRPSPLVARAAGVGARGAGRVVAAAVQVLVRVRSVRKPMHHRGQVLVARLRVSGGAGTGAVLLDDPADLEVLLRLSRSVGLPAPWPDVNGLAVRVPRAGAGAGAAAHGSRHADVLMSTTGRGRLGRYLLVPTMRANGGFVSTLVPYRSPTGPVHLGAHGGPAGSWVMLWARPGSPWRAWASLELADEPGRDLDLSFDALSVAPPGLEVYAWHRAVRGPGYAAARRSRGARSPHDVA